MSIRRAVVAMSRLTLAAIVISACARGSGPVTVTDADQVPTPSTGFQVEFSGASPESPEGKIGNDRAPKPPDSPIVRTGPLLQVRERFYFESLAAMVAQAEAIVWGEVTEVKPGLLVGAEEEPENASPPVGDEDHPEEVPGSGGGSAVRLYEVKLDPVRVFKGSLTEPFVVELLADPSNIEGAPYSLTSSWWRPGGQVLLFLQPSRREYADGASRWWVLTMEQGMYPVFSDGTVRVALDGGFEALEGLPALELTSVIRS